MWKEALEGTPQRAFLVADDRCAFPPCDAQACVLMPMAEMCLHGGSRSPDSFCGSPLESPVYRSMPQLMDLPSIDSLKLGPSVPDASPEWATPAKVPSPDVVNLGRPASSAKVCELEAAEEAEPIELPGDLFDQVLSLLAPYPGVRWPPNRACSRGRPRAIAGRGRASSIEPLASFFETCAALRRPLRGIGRLPQLEPGRARELRIARDTRTHRCRLAPPRPRRRERGRHAGPGAGNA